MVFAVGNLVLFTTDTLLSPLLSFLLVSSEFLIPSFFTLGFWTIGELFCKKTEDETPLVDETHSKPHFVKTNI